MNGNCMQCHSTEDTLWLKVPDHQASLERHARRTPELRQRGLPRPRASLFPGSRRRSEAPMSERRGNRWLVVACVGALARWRS